MAGNLGTSEINLCKSIFSSAIHSCDKVYVFLFTQLSLWTGINIKGICDLQNLESCSPFFIKVHSENN